MSTLLTRAKPKQLIKGALLVSHDASNQATSAIEVTNSLIIAMIRRGIGQVVFTRRHGLIKTDTAQAPYQAVVDRITTMATKLYDASRRHISSGNFHIISQGKLYNFEVLIDGESDSFRLALINPERETARYLRRRA